MGGPPEPLLLLLAVLLLPGSPSVIANADRGNSCAAGDYHKATWTKGIAAVLQEDTGTTAAACCQACAALPGCAVWTLNENDEPPKCGLKGRLTAKLHPGSHPGCTTGVLSSAPGPGAIFTAAEVAQCGNIRIPELTVTPSRILLFAQCRLANVSAPADLRGDLRGDLRAGLRAGVGDDMIHAKVISKASSDGGRSWENFTVLTGVSHSHGAAIYDRVTQRVVFQYQYHPTSDPELNSSYLQRISDDDGLTWGETRDITDQLDGCNPYRPVEMEVETAGSKIQSSSGRLLFTGHSKNNDSCVWYSDDHGQTYHSSSRFKGNEISMVELAPRRLLLNGRAGDRPWNPNRTQYLSVDDGATWGEGYPTTLQDNNEFGCEAALIAVSNVSARGGAGPVLFFSEPVGSSRTDLTLRCSHDGGATWPGELRVNGHGAAAYSAMAHLPGSEPAELLVIWEMKPNQVAEIVGTDWCMAAALMSAAPPLHHPNPAVLAPPLPTTRFPATAGAGGTGPCDILAAAANPCVAAHSTVRALYAKYDGPLYNVTRSSDGRSASIGVLAAGGFADAPAHDEFCAKMDCVISTLFDQSPMKNHLGQRDKPVNASRHSITVGKGKDTTPVYGMWFDPGFGYHVDQTRGVATGNDPESIYAVMSGKNFNDGCCFDYGNSESDDTDDGCGTMEAIYFGNAHWAGNSGAGTGPWAGADLESGMYYGGT